MDVQQKRNESVESAAARAIEQADALPYDEPAILVVNFSIEVWPEEKLSDVMLRIIDRVRG